MYERVPFLLPTLTEEAGVRLCVHARRSRGGALDAFEKAGADGRPRHRTEHFGNWLYTPERLVLQRQLMSDWDDPGRGGTHFVKSART